MILVRAGKGQKGGIAFFGDVKAALARAWLTGHPDPRPVVMLFVTREGVPLRPWALARILHHLSRRAGLERPIGPPSLQS